ncbi:DUF4861 domain-containing protein [Arenibacter sp. BSSL-BM3]|uniref:DUF4861 domain-containing protein n=1 Tax=Arenibacter arenosicollis TaxID=2762274 RepID=A0ABR7QIT7_9FLAO|nr:DUF4861 family protein [Arenibacter arenosicollis]MBC8767080.1 DUF4861 domain-containing protein [Arenibacter arenosicollis]
MKSLYKIAILSVSVLFSIACSEKEKPTIITVKNVLEMERTTETVELSKAILKMEDLSTIGIKNTETNQLEIIQKVDNDGDGTLDMILFQPKMAANSESKFEIVKVGEGENPTAPELCYSRFVPERTDDYTWENNKVAFRVYGPTAQKMIEDKVPGGTLSSGVDAWLKRVEYPIIDKWYKEELSGVSSYHKDTGEGLDDFHVGASRGVGGIAAKVDTTFYYSKNYTKWRTITTGPIRTSFYLEYEDWDANGKTIKESRVISLDLGQNLSKFNITLEGVDDIYAGLTLHEKDGEVSGKKDKGWVSYWQPHGDSELGTAIIASINTFIDFQKYDVPTKDLSNAYAHLKVKNNTVTYYAGFGWKKSGQFNSKQDWENYLDAFSEQINHPLEVTVTP